MKEPNQEKQAPGGAVNATPGQQREPSAARNHIEVAALAVLLSIEHNMRMKAYPEEPSAFIERALDFLDEVSLVSDEFHNPQEAKRELGDRSYTFREVLQVQKIQPPPPRRAGRCYRPDAPFGQPPIGAIALEYRPVGMTMLGCIASEKGLRNAVKNLFGPQEATTILDKKTLNFEQVTTILGDAFKRYQGSIPKARRPKNSP
jgi:hypothetical protein